MFATRAWELGMFASPRKAYVGDGSSWIWTIWKKYFKPFGFVGILDFIHALTYVYAAAMADRTETAGWPVYVRWITWVWQGQVARVIAELAQRQQEQLLAEEGHLAIGVPLVELDQLGHRAAGRTVAQFRQVGIEMTHIGKMLANTIPAEAAQFQPSAKAIEQTAQRLAPQFAQRTRADKESIQ